MPTVEPIHNINLYRHTFGFEKTFLDQRVSLGLRIPFYSLDAEAKDSGHKKVSGLGETAQVSSVIPPNAEVKVLTSKLLFDLEYSSDDPLGSTRQDDVVALAKLALGRL